MLDAARRTSPITDFVQLPESFKRLKGFNEIVIDRDGEMRRRT